MNVACFPGSNLREIAFGLRCPMPMRCHSAIRPDRAWYLMPQSAAIHAPTVRSSVASAAYSIRSRLNSPSRKPGRIMDEAELPQGGSPDFCRVGVYYGMLGSRLGQRFQPHAKENEPKRLPVRVGAETYATFRSVVSTAKINRARCLLSSSSCSPPYYPCRRSPRGDVQLFHERRPHSNSAAYLLIARPTLSGAQSYLTDLLS